MEIKIIKYDTTEYKESLKIRNEVLRKPWGRDISEDDLSLEKTNDILIGCSLKNKLMGLLVLHPESNEIIQIKYLCVYKKYEGKGIGKKLVEYAEKLALVNNYKKVVLNSRDTAMKFYERQNYKIVGDSFIPEFVSIKHIPMEKQINN